MSEKHAFLFVATLFVSVIFIQAFLNGLYFSHFRHLQNHMLENIYRSKAFLSYCLQSFRTALVPSEHSTSCTPFRLQTFAIIVMYVYTFWFLAKTGGNRFKYARFSLE